MPAETTTHSTASTPTPSKQTKSTGIIYPTTVKNVASKQTTGITNATTSAPSVNPTTEVIKSSTPSSNYTTSPNKLSTPAETIHVSSNGSINSTTNTVIFTTQKSMSAVATSQTEETGSTYRTNNTSSTTAKTISNESQKSSSLSKRSIGAIAAACTIVACVAIIVVVYIVISRRYKSGKTSWSVIDNHTRIETIDMDSKMDTVLQDFDQSDRKSNGESFKPVNHI
jgi:hypothetical protein